MLLIETSLKQALQHKQLRTSQLLSFSCDGQGWAGTWCGATMFGNVRSIHVKKLSILT